MTMRQDHTDTLFTLRRFLTPDACRVQIQRAETIGFQDAPVSTQRGPIHMPEVRNNDRVMLDDPALAHQLWLPLADHLAPIGAWQPLGLNERLRYYRYDPGQRFALHRDGSFERAEDERSFWTFMIYLNDDFEGGATRFEATTIQPVQGDALLFRHHLIHEGAEVTRGRKYVLRSDVMFRRV